MPSSRELPTDRQAIGQLLGRLLREFRQDLANPRSEHGYGDIRDPHMQIFGNIRMGGVRLTELAERAQLSLAATSELVNDLSDLGYLARRPDPADGRAKLIDLTARGQGLLAPRRRTGGRGRAPLVSHCGARSFRPHVRDHAETAGRAQPGRGTELNLNSQPRRPRFTESMVPSRRSATIGSVHRGGR